MTTKNWEEISAEETLKVLEDFYHPLIEGKVTLEDKLVNPRSAHDSGTAFFDFATNKIHMSKEFLERMHQEGEIEKEILFRGLYKHELGHYLLYPRRLSKLLYLMEFSQGKFDGFDKTVLAYWLDVMDNVRQVVKEERGRDLRATYKALNTMQEKSVSMPEAAKKYSVDKLLIGYYQIQGKEHLGVPIDVEHLEQKLHYLQAKKEGKDVPGWKTDEEKIMEEKLVELMNINFLDEKNELVNFIRFGTIITELLKKSKQEMPSLSAEKLENMLGPAISDAPSLQDFSNQQIEEALDDIIQQHGKQKYQKIRELVEKQTGKKFDEKPQELEQKRAGLEHSKLTFYDHEIPYYKRLARTFRLYIQKKPIITDAFHSYPEGQKRFKVSDPARTLNPFSTGGRILPGITRRHELKQGIKEDKKYKVPDLTLWMDSSGSMPRPESRSIPILAAYIAARNYWENGAKVGIVNFSADMAFLKPTRDVDIIYSFLTAYWGGGTVPNIPKIREYLKKTAQGHLEDAPHYTTEQDYDQLIQRVVPEHQQKEFLEKKIAINLQKPLQELYEKMDTILITDGGIYNIEEIVAYMNSTAKMTRNIIFIVGSPWEYGRWSKLYLPNTQLVNVEKPEDLTKLTLGHVKKTFSEWK